MWFQFHKIVRLGSEGKASRIPDTSVELVVIEQQKVDHSVSSSPDLPTPVRNRSRTPTHTSLAVAASSLVLIVAIDHQLLLFNLGGTSTRGISLLVYHQIM